MCTIVGEDKSAEYLQRLEEKVEQKNIRRFTKGVKNQLERLSVQGFQEREGGLYYGNMLLVNCFFIITEVIIKDEQPMYNVQITKDGTVKNLVLSPKELRKGAWVFDRVPCVFSEFEPKDAERLVRIFTNVLISRLTEDMYVKEIKFPGWTKIDGKFYYVTPDGAICSEVKYRATNGQCIQGAANTEIGDFAIARAMIQLTPNKPVASVLFVYVVLSFIHEFFKIKGVEPKFVVFLNGKRGTFKTSLALMMSQVERNSSPEYTLKSKPAGIESGYRKFKDAVMLIDDLAPVQDYSEQKRLLRNLELVIRAFGDANGKKRNYDFQEPGFAVEQYEAQGGAVITGEFLSGCESSIARSLVLTLNSGDVDVDLLSFLQEKKGVLGSFLVGFIKFVTCSQEVILKIIEDEVMNCRRHLTGRYSNQRYSEYHAQLQTAAKILIMFGEKTEQITRIEADKLQSKLLRDIEEVIIKNSEELTEVSPISVVCKAFLESLELRKLSVFNYEETDHSYQKCVIENEKFFFVQAKELLQLYKNFSVDHGMKYVDYSTTSLARELVDSGVAEPKMEGKNYRTAMKISGAGNLRFMKLQKENVYKVANQ